MPGAPPQCRARGGVGAAGGRQGVAPAVGARRDLPVGRAARPRAKRSPAAKAAEAGGGGGAAGPSGGTVRVATGTGGLKGWDPSGVQFVAPALHNTGGARAAALLTALALAGGSSVLVSAKLGAFVHLLAYSAWTGSMLYVTFIAGLTMFKNMERRAFGKLQAKLFPKYFAMHGVCLGAMGVSMWLTPGALSPKFAVGIGLSLVATLLNSFHVEPNTTRVMLARYDLEQKGTGTAEDKAEIQRLKGAFAKFHGLSSLLNLGTLCYAFAHGWWVLP